ncbi:hypothetical protein TNCV_4056731 [Trichonephila clavipes]|nr:hypothetical protein TNCV_4056731 [Trichonephila clavipes]
MDRTLRTGKNFLYVTTKDGTVHRRQPLKTLCKLLRVMEGMASIQRRYPTFRKQKVNLYPLSFPLWCRSITELPCRTACYTPTTTSDTLYRSVADYPSFCAVAKSWKEKSPKCIYFLTVPRIYNIRNLHLERAGVILKSSWNC